MKRSRLLATAGTVALLAGCGAAAPQASTRSVVRADAAAAVAATDIPTCDDGQSAVASIAPGSIGTSPGSWPSGSTMAKIRSSKRLTVGVAGDVLQWGSRDPKTEMLSGFDIDVLKRIAGEIGPDVKIDYKVINFGRRLPALQGDDVQLVADTMTITCARWFGTDEDQRNFINFSSEYYRAGQKVLVRTDSKATGINDLADESVCAATGSTSLDNIEKIVKNPVEVPDVGECLVKFQEGEATAITGDDTVLAGFAKQDPYAKVVGDPFSVVPYGIGVKAGDDDLTRFVNAVLEKMRRDGTLDDLYTKWMSGTGTRPAVPAAVYGRVLAKDRG